MDTREYWIDEDGYIVYGIGADSVVVAEIRSSEHVEALTELLRK